MKQLSVSLLLVVSACLTRLDAAPKSPKSNARPNIVFIIADDLGWADVAFHGGNTPTPHLDRLAREGLELTQHYVAPVCSPTRAGLLTGRCWSRFGITTPINTRCLPWDTVTMARALGSRDYDTCLIGKWHLGSKPEWAPGKYGFDHSYGSLAGGISPYNHRYKKGEYSVTWHRNGDLIEEEGHVTDLLTDEAVRWLHARGKAPFFLYVPYTAVHLPLKEPAAWLAQVPATITGEIARHYAASVMHLDNSVARILKALEDIGQRENTLVVFTSDNGGSTAENNDLKYPDDNCPNGRLPGNNLPLRGKKGDIYEGGTRVPTLVSWPGKIQSGKQNTPVQITDWMPTFCGLSGYQPKKNLKWDGIDLRRLLQNGTPLPERSIYTAAARWRAVSLRHGDWKLAVSGAKPKQKIELFNLANDPSERTNLAKSELDQVEGMLKHLAEAAKADRDAVVVEEN
jgi:arylsulfatase A-like enzyme